MLLAGSSRDVNTATSAAEARSEIRSIRLMSGGSRFGGLGGLGVPKKKPSMKFKTEKKTKTGSYF